MMMYVHCTIMMMYYHHNDVYTIMMMYIPSWWCMYHHDVCTLYHHDDVLPSWCMYIVPSWWYINHHDDVYTIMMMYQFTVVHITTHRNLLMYNLNTISQIILRPQVVFYYFLYKFKGAGGGVFDLEIEIPVVSDRVECQLTDVFYWIKKYCS